jgi:hypothetical protein
MAGFSCRKRCHLTNLQKNKHHSYKLQNSWNKHGEESFKFEIIEQCNRDHILHREQYWIDYYDSFKNGYNSTVGGDGRTIYKNIDIQYTGEWYTQIGDVIFTHPKSYKSGLIATTEKAYLYFNQNNKIWVKKQIH